MKATLPLLCLACAITAPGSLSAAPMDVADERRFLDATRQLTYDGKRSGEGYFSPDGKSLIFQSEREPGNPFYQIYLLNLDSGDTHRVSPGKAGPWPPGGAKKCKQVDGLGRRVSCRRRRVDRPAP